ncbi:hypothetical protein [Cryobacterium sp. Y62]|uniref:hypothetical protein n=1 Tax=Cryobacterium sp. Y62 TaxID=2048284 RepID=UPI000CE434B1|nr:hypothetical protein [Cryobacterium sp. Y62]
MAIDISEFSVSDLRRAEDGAAALLALADLLEEKGAVAYAQQMRTDSAAIRLLIGEHPSANDFRPGASIAVNEHRSELRHQLG